MLVALCEWLAWLLLRLGGPRCRPLGRAGVGWAAAVAATYFSLLQVWPAFTSVHCGWLNALSGPLLSARRCRNTPDLTDLWTLAMTPLSIAYLQSAAARGRRPSA